MTNTSDVFRIYLSHLIRGPKGDAASDQEIANNIQEHIKVGEEMRAYLIDWEKMEGFPKSYLYVPADHDEFVQIAYKRKYINEEQILDTDCAIIERSNMLIAYGNFTVSRGMKVEINYASDKGIPILYLPKLSVDTMNTLKLTIKLLLS